MVQKSPSARGRPRSFDPDQVLGRARETFWKNGFSATSMDQLVAATGLHKPSLYGAFGDKKALYLSVLDHYLAGVGARFAAALDEPELMAGLERLIEEAIDLFTRTGPSGCFMMSTAVPESGTDEEIGAVVRRAMGWLDRALERRFQKAVDAGEIEPGSDPAMLAMIVSANHYDMSSRARAGFSKSELRKLGRRTLDLVRKLSGAAAPA